MQLKPAPFSFFVQLKHAPSWARGTVLGVTIFTDGVPNILRIFGTPSELDNKELEVGIAMYVKDHTKGFYTYIHYIIWASRSEPTVAHYKETAL